MTYRLFPISSVVVVSFICSNPASALTVFDPANFSANTLQAARAAIQIKHDVTQIRQLLLMLKNTDLDTIVQVRLAMDSVNTLAGAAQSLAGTFPINLNDLTPNDVAVLHAQWNLQRREAALHAMKIQGAVVSAMPGGAQNVEVIGSASQRAEGQKSAIQLNTQMLGHVSSQIQHLQAINAAAQRLDAVREAERTTMLEYFRQRRIELRMDDNRRFRRVRVNNPFPRAGR